MYEVPKPFGRQAPTPSVDGVVDHLEALQTLPTGYRAKYGSSAPSGVRKTRE